MYSTIARDRPLVRLGKTHDAVLVIPGIMGTELYEAATGRMLWGMTKVAEYAARWNLDKGMETLALTEDERAGRLGRVVPGRLLRTPAWMPLTGGFEPYTPLVKSLHKAVVHRDAIAEFGYDWRLPVEHNAKLLADAVDRHLTAWRVHPDCVAARDRAPDRTPARIVLVAHSMGGMLTAALALIPGAVDDVRAVLTVGTPFHGAVKAMEILNSGRGMLGLPAKNLSRLARTLPGVHDLLPSYRCLDTGDDVVALTPGAVGASEETVNLRAMPSSCTPGWTRPCCRGTGSWRARPSAQHSRCVSVTGWSRPGTSATTATTMAAPSRRDRPAGRVRPRRRRHRLPLLDHAR